MHLIQSFVPLLVAALALPQNPVPTLTTVAPTAGRQAAPPPTGIAAARLWDQTGGMLEASSTPALGMLYPLSDKLFVDAATGSVGVGTTTPSAMFDVQGNAVIGRDHSVSASTSSVLGGRNNAINTSNHSTIAGGKDHVLDASFSFIGSGSGNSMSGLNTTFSTIGGGLGNSIQSFASFVGGGDFNTIEPSVFPGDGRATIAGGTNNSASRRASSIGGGETNVVDGDYGCVPGGFECRAGSSSFAVGYKCDAGAHSAAIGRNCKADFYSFAAGNQAKAVFTGCFVWADYSEGAFGSDFSSTAVNQFLVRAVGGVGIGTNTPGSQLDVAGIVRSSGPTGGSFAAYNPNHSGVSASFSWLNDVARIRIGGSGTGAQNGFDIQTVSNTSLLRIAGNGDTTAKGQMRATAFVQTSDARFKTDVRELEDAMDVVRGLRGVSFAWDPARMPDEPDTRQVGFLAQEVRDVLPEAVHEDAEGSLGVGYTQVVPVLVEALKEQDRRIAEMQLELAELRRLVTTR